MGCNSQRSPALRSLQAIDSSTGQPQGRDCCLRPWSRLRSWLQHVGRAVRACGAIVRASGLARYALVQGGRRPVVPEVRKSWVRIG
ncbi:MAG: hypothetical protein JW999_05960 [Methanotrichaceae archaeon]|nr:hypothetical protein [Methanotrichaceae archaeon]